MSMETPQKNISLQSLQLISLLKRNQVRMVTSVSFSNLLLLKLKFSYEQTVKNA